MPDLTETEQAYTAAIGRILDGLSVVEIDQAQARVNDTLIPALAKLLHVLLIKEDGDLYNYVEWDVGSGPGGPLRLTLQRISGKTPSDLYKEAKEEAERLQTGILDALQFEAEHNLQRFSPMADRLRELAGLPPEKRPPIMEAMAALKDAVGGSYYGGIDPAAYIAELRGDDGPCLCCRESGCQFGCRCLTEEMRAVLVGTEETPSDQRGPYSDGIGPADLAGGDDA